MIGKLLTAVGYVISFIFVWTIILVVSWVMLGLYMEGYPIFGG